MRPRLPRGAALAVRPGAGVKVLSAGGLEGRMIAEGRNVIYLEARGKVIKAPKEGRLFVFGGDYLIPGSALVGDPASRLVRSHGR